jgi:hypothetical protein
MQIQKGVHMTSKHLLKPSAAVAAALALAATAAPTSARPIPDPAQLAQQQSQAGAGVSTTVCSEICSGAGYGIHSSTRAGTATGVAGPHHMKVGTPALVSGPLRTPQPGVSVVAQSDGFDWGEAGIGAGVALVVSVAGIGGGVLISHRRRAALEVS